MAKCKFNSLVGDVVSSFSLFPGGWNCNVLSVQGDIKVEDECDGAKGSRWIGRSWTSTPNIAGYSLRRGLPWQIRQVATNQLVQDGMGSSLAIVIQDVFVFSSAIFWVDPHWLMMPSGTCRGEFWGQRSGHRVSPQAKILSLGYLHFERTKCSLAEERRLKLRSCEPLSPFLMCL